MGYLVSTNIKYIQAMRNKGFIFFLLLIFSGALASCSLKFTYTQPEGTWNYPGGAGPPMSMVFYSDGSLTFVGGFNNFHPAKWDYDEHTHHLRIKISNFDKLPMECETSSTQEYSCLLYNPRTDFFECRFTDKTKILAFLGWNFFRE